MNNSLSKIGEPFGICGGSKRAEMIVQIQLSFKKNELREFFSKQSVRYSFEPFKNTIQVSAFTYINMERVPYRGISSCLFRCVLASL